MAKVISKSTEVQAVRAQNLKVGDVVIFGEGETRCTVENVTLGEFVASTKVTYTVNGLTPIQRIERTYINDKAILSREVR